VGCFGVAIPDHPRDYELGIGIDGRPCPHIAATDPAGRGWRVALLGVAKAPNFIALNAPGTNALHLVEVEGGASLASSRVCAIYVLQRVGHWSPDSILNLFDG
jgi:hypothetical protein